MIVMDIRHTMQKKFTIKDKFIGYEKRQKKKLFVLTK